MTSKSEFCVRLALTMVALALSLTVWGATIPEPIGSEFQVNTFTPFTQLWPEVSALSSGKFVVVWGSIGSSGSDDSGTSIQGQLYGADGLPIGGEFQVNTYTSGGQSVAAVAADDAGSFLVVWYSDVSTGSDVSDRSIQGQLFDSGGLPIGGEFQVNTYTTSEQRDPEVAFDGDHFVVVWRSEGSGGSDNSDLSIQGQLVDSGGLLVGGEFQVNTYTSSAQLKPDVASDGAGTFVVVWESMGSADSDTLSHSIQGRLFRSDGLPVGDDFQINTYTTSSQWFPAASFDSKGDFLVVWQSESSGSDSSGSSILGQRFDPDGLPIGGEFLVNTHTEADQKEPAIAFDSSGRSVMAWANFGTNDPDTFQPNVQGQIFGSDGQPIGAEFQVNTYTTSLQARPEVTFNNAGEFVVVWWGYGTGPDESYPSIQGQRFSIPLFCDGFESGDFSAWADVVP